MRHIRKEEVTAGKYQTRRQALACRCNPQFFVEIPIKTAFTKQDGERVSCWTLAYMGVVEK